MDYEQLKLAHQLCFPIYAASRLMTREYQPFLDELGITYPQYLVLLVLWERDGVSVHEISERLILNTNTLTPLLKRLELMGLITRKRSEDDERIVTIRLTVKGLEMKGSASAIPGNMLQLLLDGPLSKEDIDQLRIRLKQFVDFLQHKPENRHH